MNLSQFKDPVFHMCLIGTLVVSWSLTHEVSGWNPFTVMTNISVKTGNSNMFSSEGLFH